jgi:hypothetical protein
MVSFSVLCCLEYRLYLDLCLYRALPLFYLVVSCLDLSCLVLPRLVWSGLVLSCLVYCRVYCFGLVLSCLVLSCLVLFFFLYVSFLFFSYQHKSPCFSAHLCPLNVLPLSPVRKSARAREVSVVAVQSSCTTEFRAGEYICVCVCLCLAVLWLSCFFDCLVLLSWAEEVRGAVATQANFDEQDNIALMTDNRLGCQQHEQPEVFFFHLPVYLYDSLFCSVLFCLSVSLSVLI